MALLLFFILFKTEIIIITVAIACVIIIYSVAKSAEKNRIQTNRQNNQYKKTVKLLDDHVETQMRIIDEYINEKMQKLSIDYRHPTEFNKKYTLKRADDISGRKAYRVLYTDEFIDAYYEKTGINIDNQGGFISNRDNLPEDDYSLVLDDAFVTDNAVISDNAVVCNNALITKNAKIMNNARIQNNAVITDNAIVKNNAIIGSDVRITHNSVVDSCNSNI